MKKAAILCVMLLALAASSALAGGLGLRWAACEGDVGAVQNLTFACNSNSGNRALAASFKLDTDLLAVLSDELVLDLATAGPTLAPWWELRTPIGAPIAACRSLGPTGAISIQLQDGASCPDLFSLQGSMNIASYTYPTVHGANQARLLCVNAVPSTAPVDLILADNPAGNGTWGVAKWTINNQKTVGTPSCGGCLTAACIVFNSCNITTVGNLHNRLVSGPANVGGDFCTWQGGAGTNCPAATPTRTTTWGTVKSLYR